MNQDQAVEILRTAAEQSASTNSIMRVDLGGDEAATVAALDTTFGAYDYARVDYLAGWNLDSHYLDVWNVDDCDGDDWRLFIVV